MANQQHLDILKQGKEAWRQWRRKNPDEQLDFKEANLRGVDLNGLNLCYADFRGANLSKADLSVADLYHADLSYSNLREANLWGADLTDADLRGANLTGADLRKADLMRTDLTGADLRKVDLTSSYLNWTILWASYSFIESVSLDVPGQQEKAGMPGDQRKFPLLARDLGIASNPSRRWQGLVTDAEESSFSDSRQQTALEEKNCPLFHGG